MIDEDGGGLPKQDDELHLNQKQPSNPYPLEDVPLAEEAKEMKMEDVPLDDPIPQPEKKIKKMKTQAPPVQQDQSWTVAGGLTTSLWSVASVATETLKKNVDKVKE